jgi:hypothetical protein
VYAAGVIKNGLFYTTGGFGSKFSSPPFFLVRLIRAAKRAMITLDGLPAGPQAGPLATPPPQPRKTSRQNSTS